MYRNHLSKAYDGIANLANRRTAPPPPQQNQQAIDAIPAVGGRVTLLEGTFLFGDSVEITKDNVTVRVNAVVFFRIVDADQAINAVENFLLATSQISQTTLRSVLGKAVSLRL